MCRKCNKIIKKHNDACRYCNCCKSCMLYKNNKLLNKNNKLLNKILSNQISKNDVDKHENKNDVDKHVKPLIFLINLIPNITPDIIFIINAFFSENNLTNYDIFDDSVIHITLDSMDELNIIKNSIIRNYYQDIVNISL